MGKNYDNKKMKKQIVDLLEQAGTHGLSKGELADSLSAESNMSPEEEKTFKRTLASWLKKMLGSGEIKVSPYEGHNKCVYYL